MKYQTMKNILLFDTHTYVKKLKSAGFSEAQAEAQVNALVDIVNDQMVSKQYLDLRFAALKTDIIKWVLGIAGAQAAFIVALLKLL